MPKLAPAPLRLSRASMIAPAPCRRAVEVLPARTDARLLDMIGTDTALRHGVLPIARVGALTLIGHLGAQVDNDTHRLLESTFGPVTFMKISEPELKARIAAQRGAQMVRSAETHTLARESCRDWSGRRTACVLAALAAGLLVVGTLWPTGLLWLATAWATLTLLAVTGLRTVAALVSVRHARKLGQTWSSRRPQAIPPDRLPTISLLVPLYREREIAGRLVKRLEALEYPRKRLDIALIVEAEDDLTEQALGRADLLDHMQIVRVPKGTLKTKPRAMNYAMNFTRGTILGIYDAEDAPAPDQLLRVAETFSRAAPNVACLQGALDFYNPRQTWLTRCFTIDYATWFRLVLPGLVKMGMMIPLGGTTVFFRRDVLEGLGRWDAHNVTEDADLGVRLARRGYRTEFVRSVTEEEATASIPAWVRQRSRWIKGYAITWAVHMRDPLRLYGELGFRKFLCFQILFLGTLSQFVLAPLLWSFWLVLLGVPHPVTDLAPWSVIITVSALFLLSEVATIGIAALSVATPKHRWLIWWVPMMHLYFPLAAIASWKGYWELITRPFFWDKTAHGQALTPRGATPRARYPGVPLPRHPA